MVAILIIALVELSNGTSVYGSSSPPQGFACHAKPAESPWSLEDKFSVARALGITDVNFEVAEKVVHKEQDTEEHCIYIGKNLAIGFSEPKASVDSVGRIKVSLAGVRERDIVSSEYRFYRFDRKPQATSPQLVLLFSFLANAGTGVRPLAWFSHDGFLGNDLVYLVVVITKKHDGGQFVYAQKVSPK